MYNRFELAKKYISFYLKASNGKGHGVHSPFVYEFIEQVLNDRTTYAGYAKPEALRQEMLRNARVLQVEDFGAGSGRLAHRNRRVKDIAASSLKPAKWAKLLYRIAKFYQCRQVVEMGTSLGITTCYLAAAADRVITMEGAAAVADMAQDNFSKAGLANIEMVVGSFDKTLPGVVARCSSPDLLFIDGNHRKAPTLQYFQDFLPGRHARSIFIFDDIHWSPEMEDAWQEIQEHPAVTLTIDLFFIGLVFFNPDFKVKQHFRIRF